MRSFVRRDLRVAVVPWAAGACPRRRRARRSRATSSTRSARRRDRSRSVRACSPGTPRSIRDIAEHGYRGGRRRVVALLPARAHAGPRSRMGVPRPHCRRAAGGRERLRARVRCVVAPARAPGDRRPRHGAARAAWFAALFPAAAVLVLGYAEATAMMLGVVVFLGLRSSRYGWAVVAGFLAGLCRPVGVLLVIPAAVEVARGLAWRVGTVTGGGGRRGRRPGGRRGRLPGLGRRGVRRLLETGLAPEPGDAPGRVPGPLLADGRRGRRPLRRRPVRIGPAHRLGGRLRRAPRRADPPAPGVLLALRRRDPGARALGEEPRLLRALLHEHVPVPPRAGRWSPTARRSSGGPTCSPPRAWWATPPLRSWASRGPDRVRNGRFRTPGAQVPPRRLPGREAGSASEFRPSVRSVSP